MQINTPGGDNKIPQFKPPQWGALLGIILIMIVVSSIGTVGYRLQYDEVGLVMRFGKYVRQTTPGFHFKLPFGIESVYKVKVTHVFKEEFGFRTVQPGVRTSFLERSGQNDRDRLSAMEQESLMLSGDLNVADVEWIVQYKIRDAEKYAFNVKDIHETLRNVAEVVMRLVVGDRHINEVLTVGRTEINIEVQKKMQEILDEYESGILINSVNLQDVTPPDPVKPSFNEVNEARQEKETTINEAWKVYNRQIPNAEGEAERMVRSAEGYALDRVNRAKGDAEKFVEIWAAYKEDKDITRTRMYLESMNEVWPKLDKKYLVSDGVNGILPLLNLNEKGDK